MQILGDKRTMKGKKRMFFSPTTQLKEEQKIELAH